MALGNGETGGNGVPNKIRDAWPQLVYRAAFPRRTVFANFGQSDVSVAEALRTQLPPALALRPTVATVDLTEDTFLTRDVARFEADLTTLVTRLQRGGRTLVVLGNVLPGDREPGVLACLPNPPAGSGPCEIGPVDDLAAQTARDDAFNAAIERVAARTGAPLADLHAAFLAARARGGEDALWAGQHVLPQRIRAPAHRARVRARDRRCAPGRVNAGGADVRDPAARPERTLGNRPGHD